MKTRTINRTMTGNSRVRKYEAWRGGVRSKERRTTSDLALRLILVPVDFSAGSLNALDIAVALAKPFGASVELLHVVDPLHAPGRFDGPRLRRLRRETVAEAKRRLANVARRNLNGRLRNSVRSGIPYSEIVEKAARINANMIVMGSRGRTGLGRFLVGSVAEKVIRHAECPVLIVRDDAGSVESSANKKRSK